MQNLSTYCQKSNFEESRNLPSSLNMKCTHGKTSKKASNSNGFKDKNTFVNEKVHAGNQIDDVFQIKEHCTIDIDVTELGKVIEGNKKNDDSGFKKEYAVSIMIKPMLGKICENGGIPFLRKKLIVHLAFNVINLTSVLIRVFFLQSLLYGDQYPCNIGKLPGNITKKQI